MKNRKVRQIVFLLMWLAVWQLFTYWMKKPLIMAGPVEIALRLMQDVHSTDFWLAMIHSTVRVLGGLMLGTAFGIGAGVFCFCFPWCEDLLEVLYQVMKSVPIASVVIMLLIWFGSSWLTLIVTFLIVFPNLYQQTLNGLRDTDVKLLEMARVYGMSRRNRVMFIYRPAMASGVMGAFQVACGTAWKAGIAAEIIGLPSHSIGEQIYLSKIYLDTVGVFSWTCVLLGISTLLGWMLSKAMHWALTFIPRGRAYVTQNDMAPQSLVLQGLKKSYRERELWRGYRLSISLEQNECYALMAPSGEGKTTLFRILAGLEEADEGNSSVGPEQIALCFEESRFLPELTLLQNLKMIGIDSKKAQAAIEQLFEAEEWNKKLKEYSLGMKRRAEVIRCMLSGKAVLLLDEPFNGLDAFNREKIAQFILEQKRGRLILFSTHKEAEVELLNAKNLKKNWNFQ